MYERNLKTKKPSNIMESFSLVVKVNDYFTTHNILNRMYPKLYLKVMKKHLMGVFFNFKFLNLIYKFNQNNF